MKISPLAGKPAPASMLVNVPRLVTAYYTEVPDPSVPTQRVAFGTSGHRGSSFDKAFNEWHILAISQAICLHRKQHQIDGPLFLGMDTHALSVPALASALEVLAANGVEVMLAKEGEYTPTPVISHAILTYNHGRKTGLADGIVITPSHNPPHNGGFKYNPPSGGPAEELVTDWIQAKANEFLEAKLQGVRRIPFEKARTSTTHRHDYLNAYIADVASVLDMETIRGANLRLGVDPLGGAGVHYWGPISERYGLDLTVVNESVDPTFRFMTVDWDGQIRMDPSSVYAMQRLNLARAEKMSAKQFNEMVTSHSGLLGISETSSDMRDLLDRETQDVRAAEAVALFCYQIKKWIGAFAAALGGLDTLAFAGGIGENAPAVRARICDGLGFLGITIEEKKNAANEAVISASSSRVAIRVIRTDEARMIAEMVCCVLGLSLKKEN